MSENLGNSSASPPNAGEAAVLRELVAGVVRAQGNSFIKELLREKSIKLGTTKEDFERNLFAAIDAGQLQLADVEKWLEEVEGWGNQHIYCFSVCEEIARSSELASREAMRRKVGEAGLDELWEADTSQAFPETLQLTSIRFDGETLRLTWHEGDTSWYRGKKEKELDFKRPEGLDLYEFRAWREMRRRGVMRFELRLAERLAGIFLSIAFDEPGHAAALQSVVEILGRLLDIAALQRDALSIADVIKQLDQNAALRRGPSAREVASQSTRLESGGGYVELGSSSQESSYLDYPALAALRISIRDRELTEFQGSTGIFKFLQTGIPELTQDVLIHLYGNGRRIRIAKQLKVEEVWAILRLLARHR
jgi:hypothetical protein